MLLKNALQQPAHTPLGFTLLEVLIALLILALALFAGVRAAGLEARALGQVREATLAQWVAANTLAEMRLRGGLPQPGSREGRSVLGEQRWRWIADVASTEAPQIRRIEVQVFVDRGGLAIDARPAASLVGFIGR